MLRHLRRNNKSIPVNSLYPVYVRMLSKINLDMNKI